MTFVSTPFRTVANSSRVARGFAALPIVVIPHPLATKTIEEIEATAERMVAQVVQALTDGART